jgi:asparagine N-glycosylation enzyme membrane subunit Stt3
MNLSRSPNTGNWKWELAAVLIAVLAVAARCLPWRFVYTDAGVFLPGVDPYYHLWHARHLVEQFPHWSLVDPYLNFPIGAPYPYLAGFDLFLALPGLFGGNADAIAPWAAFMMPLLGGVAVYLTYRLGRAVFDRTSGLAGAVLMALMCGAMNYTMVGRVDHHGAVAPVLLGVFLLFLASLRAETKRRTLIFGCLCGLLAGWSVALWVITPPLYFLPVPLALFWLCLRGRGPDVRLSAFAILGTALLAAATAAWLAGDLRARPFELFLPSWISILPFASAALWISVATYRSGWSLLVPGGMAFVVILSLGLGLFEIEPLTRVASVVGGRSTAYTDIIESQPLLSVNGLFTFNRAVAFYSHLFLLWPFLLGGFVYQVARADDHNPGGPLLTIFILLGGSLLMLQQRFGEYAAPAVALLMAWALVGGTRAFLRYARLPGHRRRAAVFACALVPVLAMALYPLGEGLVYFASIDTVARSRNLADFGRRLADSTPNPLGPDGQPEYGLLTSEEDAVVLLASAELPVVVSSFGLSQIQAHNREGYRILLTEDEAWASQRLKQLRVRYLVVSPILNRIESMARVAGLTDQFLSMEREMDGKNTRVSARPRPPFVRSLHTRLLLADGSRNVLWGIEAPALSRFRLHLESKSTTSVLGLRVPAFKAFEVVTGATLVGQARENTTVRLGTRIRTNTGRTFTYRAETMTDSTGRYEFLVPYATSGSEAPCRAVGPYQIKAGGQVFHVQVPEEAISQGADIAVYLQP